MTKIFWKLLIISALCLLACDKKVNHPDIKITKQKNGYGYQIVKGNKVFINQPYIPAVPGDQSFKDSLQARKTAELVVSKIERSSFPRISINELDSMKIEYEIKKFQ